MKGRKGRPPECGLDHTTFDEARMSASILRSSGQPDFREETPAHRIPGRGYGIVFFLIFVGLATMHKEWSEKLAVADGWTGRFFFVRGVAQ